MVLSEIPDTHPAMHASEPDPEPAVSDAQHAAGTTTDGRLIRDLPRCVFS
jgi:hypothetical protein